MYTILIVDDERNERAGIESLIHKYGFSLKISQAANGEEALKIFEKEKIDILLTDIKMPLMSGIELIEQVQRRGWHPICIIYSAYGEFEYAQNAIALGVTQYLLKPIRLEEFQQLFRKIIEICDEKEFRENENEKVRQKLKTAQDEKIARMFLRYLESERENYSEKIQEICCSSYVPFIVSAYSNMLSKYWENYEADIRKILNCDAMIMSKSDMQFVILVKDILLTARQISGICEKIIEISKHKYQSEVFIVAGENCGDYRVLKKMYVQLQEQLDYQFFVSKSMYFLYSGSGIVKKTSEMLPLYFEKILTFAKLEDYEGMKLEFDKAFNYVEKSEGFSSIYIKYNFSEVIKRFCITLKNEEYMLQVVEEIYGSNSIVQVKEAIFHLIDTLSAERKGGWEENRIVALTKSIIHERYSDYTLSVSSVAEELSVSAAYLSTLFKSETKQNLVKYISKYRIEKAKDILKTRNLKVADVAAKVGYLNTSYFIALFKNMTGCSPAKYRERQFGNE